MSSRKAAGVLICIGCISICAALALMGYNVWDDQRAQASVTEILTSVQEQMSSKDPDIEITDYQLDPYMEMPAVEINGYLFIGEVSIPALELELPVIDTWDYSRMKIAPCRYSGSVYLNDLILCAHNYTSHFGRLKNLASGDKVNFTDMDGNVFSYEVAEVQTLAPTAVEEMKSSGYDLTLFTCTIGGQARVTVRCNKTPAADAQLR